MCCDLVNNLGEYQGEEALDEQTRVVLLSIGGNDLLFAEIVTECYVIPGALSVAFSPITNAAILASVDDAAERFCPSEAELLRRGEVFTQNRLRDTIREIKSHAPNSSIVLVGYPNLAPAEQNLSLIHI